MTRGEMGVFISPRAGASHSSLPGGARGARWSRGLEQVLLNHASDATYSGAGNRIVSVGTA
jgi:hypothetical protein